MGRWESFELPWAREDWLWNRRVGRTSCIRPNRRWRGTRKTCNRTEPLGIHCKSPGPISIEMASCPASSAGPAPPCLNTWRICKQWAMGNGPGANQLLGHLSGGKSNIISVNHRWGEQNTLNWPVDVFQGEVRFRLIAMNDYLFTTWIRLWSFIIGWLSTIRVLGGGERGGRKLILVLFTILAICLLFLFLLWQVPIWQFDWTLTLVIETCDTELLNFRKKDRKTAELDSIRLMESSIQFLHQNGRGGEGGGICRISDKFRIGKMTVSSDNFL